VLKQAGIPFNILDPSAHGIEFYGDGLITSTALCQTDPDLVRYFRDVSLVGWYYALSHTEEMVDLILDEYSTEKSREALLHEAQEIIKLVDVDSFLLGSVDLQRIERIAEGLIESGISSSVDSIGRFIFDPANPFEINSTEQSATESSSTKDMPAGEVTHDTELTLVTLLSILIILIAIIVLIFFVFKYFSRFTTNSKGLDPSKDQVSKAKYIATILAVDDAPAILHTLTELLTAKYKVKVAPNGAIALKIAQASVPPDLILLDVMMPGMSGFDVARELQASDATREIPIIFVTGRTDDESISEGYRVGGVDYVPKPFNPDELLARVETHLSLRDARGQVEEMSRSHDT